MNPVNETIETVIPLITGAPVPTRCPNCDSHWATSMAYAHGSAKEYRNGHVYRFVVKQ